MGATAFSFILLPLCLLWIMSPNKLLQLLVIAAVFEAAAALTIGSLGLQPGLVPAFAFMAFVGLQLLLGARYPGKRQVLHVTRPFVLVTLWALASSYLMPRLFEGMVFVWPQKATPPFVLTALAPSPSNINQDFYLAINCVFMVAMALYLTRPRLSLLAFMKAYFLSGFLVAGISVWQFASKMTGIPYPDDLFYSNPGWSILTTQVIGNIPRINGPFSEPAALATYMASIVCATGWPLLQGHRDKMVPWLFITGLLTVLLSTSTTGFAVLFIVGVGIPFYAIISRSRRLMAGVVKIGVPLVLLVVMVAVGASVFFPQFNQAAGEILDATLNKPQSSSYLDRTSADLDSLTATLDTYGLGAGWGSNRSSSLVPGLLAGLGVPGCLGLVWFGMVIARRVRWARRAGSSRDHLLVIDGCCGGLIGFLVAATISAPTLSSVTFFFLLALLIGCVVRVELNARASAALLAQRLRAQSHSPEPVPVQP